MINGTQMMTAIGVDATVRAHNVAICSDVAAAFSVEVLKGTRRAFHSCIHSVRPHAGQNAVAKRLRTLLTPSSELFESHKHHGRVQDSYSLRCTPQVHGISHDTIAFVEGILTTEANSALDNPMVFTGSDADEDGWELSDTTTGDGLGYTPKQATSSTFNDGDSSAGVGGFVISGGNFHGEYPVSEG